MKYTCSFINTKSLVTLDLTKTFYITVIKVYNVINIYRDNAIKIFNRSGG